MAEWSVRRATAADIERVADLRLEFLSSVGREPEASLRSDLIDYLGRAIPSGACVYWVGEAEDRIVATGAMCVYERLMWNGVGREGYVLSMYTEPPWRGRGIATAIVERMQAFARQEGLKLCLVSLDEARPIYERAGFEPDHRYMRWR